nr:MAG TPA: hypothetical protein [Caudoviricetes sp.]
MYVIKEKYKNKKDNKQFNNIWYSRFWFAILGG